MRGGWNLTHPKMLLLAPPKNELLAYAKFHTSLASLLGIHVINTAQTGSQNDANRCSKNGTFKQAFKCTFGATLSRRPSLCLTWYMVPGWEERIQSNSVNNKPPAKMRKFLTRKITVVFNLPDQVTDRRRRILNIFAALPFESQVQVGVLWECRLRFSGREEIQRGGPALMRFKGGGGGRSYQAKR